jgi:hypothetical protein
MRTQHYIDTDPQQELRMEIVADKHCPDPGYMISTRQWLRRTTVADLEAGDVFTCIASPDVEDVPFGVWLTLPSLGDRHYAIRLDRQLIMELTQEPTCEVRIARRIDSRVTW